MTRTYRKRQRAEREEETRRRITEAAVALHEEVGPARTTITDIAERAGVTRPTVYKHFPDEVTLFTACSGHYVALHPPPDPSEWAVMTDAEQRLRRAITELYDYYRRTESMTAKVIRDAESLPALRQVVEQGWGPYMQTTRELLLRGWNARGPRRRRLLGALGVALNFGTWQQLVRADGLDDREAAELMTALARSAVAPG
jgi:AcrR family transcriptional regulator